ncbi:MAG TPA: AraC family transcriptional regulator [Hyphomicrobiaceae bacterium]|nr:AraC family transcriptional regulator [Hyphomicrobiaceae bacterium]
MQILGPGSIRFSLDGIPEHERLAVFREVFGRMVLRYDLEPLPDIPFNVDLRFRTLPDLMMMTGWAHGSRNQRTAETIAADSSDDVGMIVNLRGPHRIVHAGREIVLEDGDATLVSMGEVCSFTHRPPGDILALRVPRKQLAPLVRGVDDQYLRLIPHGTPALRFLTNYIKLAQDDLNGAQPELQHLMAGHVHDLIAMVVGATRDGAQVAESRGLRAARLQAIKQDIAKCVDQNDLSLAAIAARHHCTPRYVQRLFESEGTTFTDYVLAQRLARAYRLLTDPRRAGEKISAIAFESGFGDVSYFNRAFRQCYGETPSGIRSGRTMN